MFYSSAKRQEYRPSTHFARFHQPLLWMFCAAIQHTHCVDRSIAVAPHCHCSCPIAIAPVPLLLLPQCPIAVAPLQTIYAVAPLRRPVSTRRCPIAIAIAVAPVDRCPCPSCSCPVPHCRCNCDRSIAAVSVAPSVSTRRCPIAIAIAVAPVPPAPGAIAIVIDRSSPSPLPHCCCPIAVARVLFRVFYSKKLVNGKWRSE
jgi:hypothetical protein